MKCHDGDTDFSVGHGEMLDPQNFAHTKNPNLSFYHKLNKLSCIQNAGSFCPVSLDKYILFYNIYRKKVERAEGKEECRVQLSCLVLRFTCKM